MTYSKETQDKVFWHFVLVFLSALSMIPGILMILGIGIEPEKVWQAQILFFMGVSYLLFSSMIYSLMSLRN